MADTGTIVLAAISADPAEDAPRLAYADWLDERGNPGDAERAEIIRVQIAAARLHPESARRVTLETRAEELLAAHGFAWWADVCEAVGMPVADTVHREGDGPGRRETWHFPWPAEWDESERAGYRVRGRGVEGVAVSLDDHYSIQHPWPFSSCRFRRGFPDSVALQGRRHADGLGGPEAVEALPRWTAAVPLRGVTLTHVQAEDAAAIFGPALSRVSRLGLVECGDEVLDALAESPHLGALTDLGVWFYSDPTQGVPEWDSFAGELARFLRTPLAARLRSLSLTLCTDAAAEALAGAGLPGLSRLNVDVADLRLSGARSGERGRRLAIVTASPGLTGLRRLAVAGLRPGSRLALAGPACSRLRSLSIHFETRPRGVPMPSYWLDALPPTLREVRLCQANVTEAALDAMAASNVVRGLRHLRLGGRLPDDPRRLAALVDPARVGTFVLRDRRLGGPTRAALTRVFGDRFVGR